MSAWQQRQHVPPVMAAPFSPWRSAVCGQHQHLPPPHHGTPLRTPSLPPDALCAGLQRSPAHRFQVLGQIWKGQGSGKRWCNSSSKNNGNDSVKIWMRCVLNCFFLLHGFCISLWYTLKPDEALSACVEQSKQRELISAWKLSHEPNSRDPNHWWQLCPGVQVNAGYRNTARGTSSDDVALGELILTCQMRVTIDNPGVSCCVLASFESK